MSKREDIEKAMKDFINYKDWDTKTGKYAWMMAAELYDAIKHLVETGPTEEEIKSNTVEIGGKIYIKGPKEILKK